jgi:hypothetical protein
VYTTNVVRWSAISHWMVVGHSDLLYALLLRGMTTVFIAEVPTVRAPASDGAWQRIKLCLQD